jgi:hypothetical protein
MSKKIYQFFINGLLLEPKIFLLFILSFITGTNQTAVQSVSQEELLAAVRSGRSIIRLGDGEAMLLMGRDIHFQPYSPTLRDGLRNIITTYTDESPYIIGVPVDQLAASDKELKDMGRMRVWRLFKIYFQYHFSQTARYCSLVMFYHQNTFEHKIASALSNHHIICVGNGKVLDEKLRTYFSANFPQASFIIAPGHDAFKDKERITQEIDVAITAHPQVKPIILIAVGPASKVISYEFAKRGIQALDIGHGMEIISRDINYASRV